MDDPECPHEQLSKAMQSIDRAHRIFRTFRPIIKQMNSLISEKSSVISVVDMGAGTGILGEVLQNQFGDRINYIGLEKSRRMLDQFFRGSSSIHGDGSKSPFRTDSIDVVTSSFVLHHLPAETLVPFLIETDRISRKLTFHIDLTRNRFVWATAWLLTRLLSRNPIFHHDGPVSVARSLTHKEWTELLRQPRLSRYQLTSRHPLLEYIVNDSPNRN